MEDKDEWNYRSTAGTQDVSEGYAELRKLSGNMESSTIKESLTHNLLATGVKVVTVDTGKFKSKLSNTGTYNFQYTPIVSYSSDLIYSLNKSIFATYTGMQTGDYKFTYTANVAQVDTSSVVSSFNQKTFIAKVNETPDTYTFTYSQADGWKLDDNKVTMSQYGITTNGSETEGTNIVIYYTSNSWYYNGSSVSLTNYGIATNGTEKVDDTFTINYEKNEWQYNSNAVTLADYGISITTGTPAIDDIIQIVFVAEQVGVVVVANPTALYSVGLNQFNKDGNQIFTGFTIDTSGKIVEQMGSYVIYFKCLGKNTYTIYDSVASSITRAGYIANIPTTSSTTSVLTAVTTASSGQACTNNATRTHYTPANDGYICVATTDINSLCCHLTWSGYNDDIYESYWDYSFTIDYRDEHGSPITEYGLGKLDSTYVDEIDYVNHKFYKRTDRIEYSAQNLSTVQGKSVPYLYDSDWIYYGIPEEVYNLDSGISSAYRVSDFGTEQFIGTDLKLGAEIFYQQNLKDKLRRSVEILENKTQVISASSTEDQYPSAKAVYNMNYNIYKMLGLHVDTFSTTKTYAVGDYVVRGNILYKCKTAVTAAGAWNANNWEESYLFTAS